MNDANRLGSVLYISYDGILESLGQSQVLNYLKGLCSKGWCIYLVSYEKKEDWLDESARRNIEKEVERAGIRWRPLRYHRRFSLVSTLFDVLTGWFWCMRLYVKGEIAIVHARSYVAALIALPLVALRRVRFLFDMRGFWADEKADEGVWKRDSFIYALIKRFEKIYFSRADAVVSLTEAAIEEVRGLPYMQGRNTKYAVIPTCADTEHFTPADAEPVPCAEFVLGYVGSVRGWYEFEWVVKFFVVLLRVCPSARLLVLSKNDHDFIRDTCTRYLLSPNQFDIFSVDFTDIPRYMKQMNAGIFVGKSAMFANKGRVPTKFAEFLSCGVPCICNRGVGDVESLISQCDVGALLEDYSDRALRRCADTILSICKDPDTRDRCRDAAITFFSLTAGVQSYDRVYHDLAGLLPSQESC